MRSSLKLFLCFFLTSGSFSESRCIIGNYSYLDAPIYLKFAKLFYNIIQCWVTLTKLDSCKI